MGCVKWAITVCGPLQAKRPLEDVLSQAMSHFLSVISTLMPEQWAQEAHFRTWGIIWFGSHPSLFPLHLKDTSGFTLSTEDGMCFLNYKKWQHRRGCHSCNFPKTVDEAFTPGLCCDWPALQNWESSRAWTSLWSSRLSCVPTTISITLRVYNCVRYFRTGCLTICSIKCILNYYRISLPCNGHLLPCLWLWLFRAAPDTFAVRCCPTRIQTLGSFLVQLGPRALRRK